MENERCGGNMALLPNVSDILALMYTDKMTAWHYEDLEDEDGATVTILSSIPFLEDTQCRISFGGKDSPVKGNDNNGVDIQPTLIYSPNITLENGDFVEVIRNGQSAYSGNIGKPNPYGSSMQVLFQHKDNG